MTPVRRRRTAASVVAVISSLAGFAGMTSQRTDAADATEIDPSPYVDGMLAETTARIASPVTSQLDNRLALPDPCSLITQAEAEAASGFPTRPGEVLPTEMVPLGTIQLCNFLAADTPADAVGGVAVIRVGVLDLGDDPAARFAEFAQYMAMSNGSVPGLGDENFYIEIEGTALLFLRTQNIFISVSALVPDGLAQATAIAQRALTRLGDASDGGTLTSQAPGGATGAGWPDDRCGIVSEELVSAAVGEAVTAQDFPPFGCQYLGDANGVVIDYFSIAAECETAEARTDDPEIVDGLGIHAAFVSANIDEALAVTIDNGLCFFVHGTYGGDIDSDAARIAIAQAIIASSQAPGGPTGATGAEWPDDHCSIVSEELVSAAVGEAVTAHDVPYYGCEYRGDANGFLIYYDNIAWVCEGAEARDLVLEIVDGLGVYAAFVSFGSGPAIVVTLDNGLCFLVYGTSDANVVAVAEAVIAASQT